MDRITYGEPHQSRDGAWFVAEHSADYTARIMLLTRDDQTAGEPTPYDPRCSMCWLGYAHSGNVHRDRLNNVTR